MQTTRTHRGDTRKLGFTKACATGVLGLVLGGGTMAAAQVQGHAYGQPADLVGPHVGTVDSPVRVSPALGAGNGQSTQYQLNLGFTRATIECCVGASCEVLQGKVMVYGDAVSTMGSEGLSFGRGTVGVVDVYGFEPTSSVVVGQPVQMHGTAHEGTYTRAGMDLALTLEVPDWTWITRTGSTRTCPSATVRIEGSMAAAPCGESRCADDSEQHFGFGPSTLTIFPAVN